MPDFTREEVIEKVAALESLYRSDLAGIDLSDALLMYTNLRSANLYRADLSDASLRKADLRKAHLGEANLHTAELFGADLRWANLAGANLSTAVLSGSMTIGGLIEADLRGAWYNKDTKFPEDFDPEAAGMMRVSY